MSKQIPQKMTKIRLLKFVKQLLNKPLDWRTNPRDNIHPKHFGITSHLQEFYCPDKTVLNQGDEFPFLVEPKRKKNWLIRFSLVVGVNLLLLGVVFSSIGYLTPQQDIIIGRIGEYIIVDRWANVYNNRLLRCQFAGLLSLTCGLLVTFCSLLLYNCEQAQRREYYVMKTKAAPQRFIEPPIIFKTVEDYWGMHCIPSSGTVKVVQPGFVESKLDY